MGGRENEITTGFSLPIYQKENKVQIQTRWCWAKQVLTSMPEDLHKENHSEIANNFLTVCRRTSSSKTQLIDYGAEKTSREKTALFETSLHFKIRHKNKEK